VPARGNRIGTTANVLWFVAFGVCFQISCANRGVFEAVADGSDLSGRLTSYFQFLASGLTQSNVVWLEPYEDAFGLGLVTTAAVPAYDHSTNPKVR